MDQPARTQGVATRAGVATAAPQSGVARASFVRPEVTLIGPMVELTLNFGGTFTTP